MCEKKTERLHLRVCPSSKAKLENMAKRAGISLSKTMEQLIEESPIREMPPLDYFHLLSGLRQIGTNINQVAHVANYMKDVHYAEYIQNWRELQQIILEIRRSVELR
ncbi:MobC family plasmid mobilization relaxosome protein [Ruminococcaceae bacterium OttesenSCG-928-A16]|nr:MobC family plasmid mobilization relaxosome protein [Ruminococcaceae bacterium OttesenSCG-928-A16]